MINYRNIKGRHYWGMSADDLVIFSEIMWLLKHSPNPVGFNRKPFTAKQKKMIEDFYEKIEYPKDFAEVLNSKHGQ